MTQPSQKEILAIAIAVVASEYKDDVLSVFSTAELEEVLKTTEHLQGERVENLLKQAWDRVTQVCEHCDDGEGNSIYPHYGLAPHTHATEGWPVTKLEPRDTWPDNFVEDQEAPGCGTYTHCLNCEGEE